jgi:hypothetical protein
LAGKVTPPYFAEIGEKHEFIFLLTRKQGRATVTSFNPSVRRRGFAEYPERPVYKLNQINIPLGGG